MTLLTFRCWQNLHQSDSSLNFYQARLVLQGTKMATESDNDCPICQDTWKDVASALPCHHQFCLGCILRWARRNPVCPLCRRTIETIRFSDYGEGDYLETAITAAEELPDGSSMAGRAPDGLDENSPHPPGTNHSFSPQEILSQAEQEGSGSILPEDWAELFRQQEHLLDPVWPWLRQRLEGIYRGWWWVVETIESTILHGLCIYGLNAEVLIEVLELLLQEHAAPLIHSAINIIVGQCSEEAQKLMHSDAVRDENNSPVATASSSSSSYSRSSSFSSSSFSSSQKETPASSLTGSDMEEEPATSEASLLPQGSSHSPSAPSQGRE
ncbi:uncharacterized protein LOC113961085 [Neopelma chrysocephalum]|uniref:uncharacterized protein LOC113961085 n=1 Tax=Neopelma chrysocephalum TaxID=114329 RepID=UPI000FCD3676|nr:uncharacterized protein LOC113961085 [Neopelma chrysocephalum]